MRIKRLATVGTSLLVMVCIGLYLMLDRTLTNEQKTVKRAKPIYDRMIFRSQENTPSNNSFVEKFSNMGEDLSLVCSAPAVTSEVDVQMGHVYETVPFDDIDGGVWKQGWNVVYNEEQWNPDRKLKIFVVPHSHNDPGWKKTFEDYYTSQTRSILNNMVTKLMEDRRRKFIWAEISFFSLWWSEIPQSTKDNVALLISRGQLEFVTGGWVMADEANSHYYSVIEQLTHGHQWLLTNLGYKPKYSWSIDPFGLSPTFPFLLKKAGFNGLAVQRTHYIVKKYLARKKQLEFNWRQLWDNTGWTGLLTHMMPFYSYDVPHTCGPDPKICCQFDFKRLPGLGVTCPWRIPPQAINQKNLAQRAELLLDQYRKKAQLYSSNVLLVPLGDDFRYDHSTEWDAQYTNYQKIFDYINNNPHLNAQAQFGTLSDYFKALESEKESGEFPTLSGDFFTYADREDHYWSGYYTSRPFYKRMDRVLLSYLRSAELLLMLASRVDQLEALPKLNSNLSDARASLSLFQHHDGITGTAKDHVVQDYAAKMLDAIHKAQHVMQQCSYYLLKNGQVPLLGNETYLIVEEHQKVPYGLAEGSILYFPSNVLSRKVVLFNPLLHNRFEVVSIRVQNRFVQVRNSKGHIIDYQISPTCNSANSALCYTLTFNAEIPPLSLVTYSVEAAMDESIESHIVLKHFGKSYENEMYDDWKNKELESPKDFTLHNNNITVAFSKTGFLKAIIIKKPDNVVTVPVHLSFVKYSTKQGKDKSGAYLFLPDGEAEEIRFPNPKVTIVEGTLMSHVTVKLPNVEHTVIIHHSDPDGIGIEIRNLVNIATINNNYELAMRLSTNIKNQKVFYTDLNSFQVIKRKTLDKLPLQGNFYPMPSAAYIEDKNTRLTVLSGQPLGVASLHEGQLEIMQDRRLLQDDNRGLDQPVMDNRPTLSVFKVIVETKISNCEIPDSTWGKLSSSAYSNLQKLLYPVQKLIYTKDGHVSFKDYISPVSAMPTNFHLVTSMVLPGGIGVLLQSTSVEACYGHTAHDSGKKIDLSHAVPIKDSDRVYKSTLTFNDMLKEMPTSELSICENDIEAYFIRDS